MPQCTLLDTTIKEKNVVTNLHSAQKNRTCNKMQTIKDYAGHLEDMLK
jgi:hypothetical protein